MTRTSRTSGRIDRRASIDGRALTIKLEAMMVLLSEEPEAEPNPDYSTRQRGRFQHNVSPGPVEMHESRDTEIPLVLHHLIATPPYKDVPNESVPTRGHTTTRTCSCHTTGWAW